MFKNFSRILSIGLLLSTLLAGMVTLPVLAQDQTPPPVETTAEVPPVEPPVVGEGTPPSEPASPADSSAVVEESATDQQPALELPAPDESVSEVLEQLPEGTDLVVLDPQGETVPLASREAARAITSNQVSFTLNGSTMQFTTIGDALGYLQNNGVVPDDGTIYVSAGTFNENVYYQTFYFAPTDPVNVSLVGAGSGETIVNGSFEFSNTGGGLGLSGFTINGFVWLQNHAGPAVVTDVVVNDPSGTGNNMTGSSFLVAGNGDVTLDQVVVSSGSSRIDAYNGNIFINNSRFAGPMDVMAGWYPDPNIPDDQTSTFTITCSNSEFSGGLNIFNGIDNCTGGGQPLPPIDDDKGTSTVSSSSSETSDTVSAESLPDVTEETLPAELPATLSDGSTFNFSGGFDASGIEIEEGESVTIEFSLPEGVAPENLVILFWNGTEWVEITSFTVLPDGTVLLTITTPGVIVFGSK